MVRLGVAAGRGIAGSIPACIAAMRLRSSGLTGADVHGAHLKTGGQRSSDQHIAIGESGRWGVSHVPVFHSVSAVSHHDHAR
jgi:hypothetical protein